MLGDRWCSLPCDKKSERVKMRSPRPTEEWCIYGGAPQAAVKIAMLLNILSRVIHKSLSNVKSTSTLNSSNDIMTTCLCPQAACTWTNVTIWLGEWSSWQPWTKGRRVSILKCSFLGAIIILNMQFSFALSARIFMEYGYVASLLWFLSRGHYAPSGKLLVLSRNRSRRFFFEDKNDNNNPWRWRTMGTKEICVCPLYPFSRDYYCIHTYCIIVEFTFWQPMVVKFHNTTCVGGS